MDKHYVSVSAVPPGPEEGRNPAEVKPISFYFSGSQPCDFSEAAGNFYACVDGAICSTNWGRVLELVRQTRGKPEWGGILSMNTGHGADSPIGAAVAASQTMAVRSMVAAGADPDSRDWFDRTLLMSAMEQADLSMASCLLDLGANASASGRGGSALMQAIHGDHVERATFLIAAGAELETLESVVEAAAVRGAVCILRHCLASAELAAPLDGVAFDDLLGRVPSDAVRAELLSWRSAQQVAVAIGVDIPGVQERRPTKDSSGLL
jgi:hypothetical protein